VHFSPQQACRRGDRQPLRCSGRVLKDNALTSQGLSFWTDSNCLDAGIRRFNALGDEVRLKKLGLAFA
jgi:hypothetical protein